MVNRRQSLPLQAVLELVYIASVRSTDLHLHYLSSLSSLYRKEFLRQTLPQRKAKKTNAWHIDRHDDCKLTKLHYDPMFVIEAELTRMKNETINVNRSKEGVTSKQSKAKRNKKKYVVSDADPLSTVSMLHKGGRLFERRVTEIGGKMVTVEMGNKHLHGIDLIVRPGSVVHGTLPYSEEEASLKKAKIDKRSNTMFRHKDGNPLSVMAYRQHSPDISIISKKSVAKKPRKIGDSIVVQSRKHNWSWETEMNTNDDEQCFAVHANTALSSAAPTQLKTTNTAIECLTTCARNSRCYSVNFYESTLMCEIFIEFDYSTAELVNRHGCTFYKRKQMDTLRCMRNVLRSNQRQFGFISNSTSRDPKMAMLKIQSASYRLLSSRAECPKGLGVLFVRSSGARDEKGTKLDVVYNISEDDCIFSCLTNKAIDEHPMQCASVEYESNSQRCTISSKPRTNALSTSFYLCLANGFIGRDKTVSNQCSGATLERITSMVIMGFVRDTATTIGIDKCIERCVMAQQLQGFKCLSIMYYHDETLPNCIMNEASSRTNPESTYVEPSSNVDYISLDDCYGLPETMNIRKIPSIRRKP
ncbi:PAN domain protein [Dictyocaulus viviparus]|uniref:PAN domain protein n=1 Tax=Dictyocaulus viviparus TaxID=29172 RepID=A0A0D8XNV8_DICVI|nr:PAN domain protein [Dictyocaulus viviparus]